MRVAMTARMCFSDCVKLQKRLEEGKVIWLRLQTLKLVNDDS